MNRSVTDDPGRSGADAGAFSRVLAAGGIAGVLDFAFAISIWGFHGVAPIVIPQSVASGLVGASAFSLGPATAALGTALHLAMTTLMAGIYLAAAPARFRSMPFVTGPAYGAMIWVIMNKVVVPISAAPIQPPPPGIALADLAAHMALVGLPIAIVLRCAPPEAARR